jgi:hypothetical protein
MYLAHREKLVQQYNHEEDIIPHTLFPVIVAPVYSGAYRKTIL